ncbi:MAG: Arc family DNA-binding protein [Microscillaceae bacterium]|jgi:hypothetical protein|nr:Arc family DNA-binding protein [Microscillaceae bacterium]
MGKKKAFALRIDEEVLNAVEKWAADDFRSTNGQIEWIIFQALRRVGRLKNFESETKNEDASSPPTPDEEA